MNRNCYYLIFVAILLAQLACSFGGILAPANEPANSPSGQPIQAGSAPTSTPIGVEIATQPPVDEVEPTPALNLDIPKPQSGTGNIAGRILWNSQPVVGTEVKLCENMGMFTGCEGTQFSAKTDDDGVYVLANTTPGEYALVVHAIDSDSWLYITSGLFDARKFLVEADKTVVLEDQHLYKYDLKQTTPADKARISEAQPTLKWDAYPGAAYYDVYLAPDGALTTIIQLDRFTGVEITPDQPLLACDYLWRIEAYNDQGVKIAEYDGYSNFTIVDQPVSCNIAIKSPADKTQVPASGVKLAWEKHSLAAYYKLVVWKGDVGGETVVDYARIDGATTYSFDQPLAPGEYIWSVNAYNSSDDMIAGSALYNFIVK